MLDEWCSSARTLLNRKGECLAPLMEVLIWRFGMPSTITRRDPSAAQIIAAFHRPYAGYRGMQRFLRLLRCSMHS